MADIGINLMAHVYIGGERYRLSFRKNYSIPVGYYFRRDNLKEIIFYNLSPRKSLERHLIETILEVEGATKAGDLERKTTWKYSAEGVYSASVDPESYRVRELKRLNGIPKVNGHVHPAILEKVLSQGIHVVSISGKNRPKANLFAPVDEYANLFFGSSVTPGTLRMVKGVGMGPNPMAAVQEAYFNASDNAPYL